MKCVAINQRPRQTQQLLSISFSLNFGLHLRTKNSQKENTNGVKWVQQNVTMVRNQEP